MMQVNKVENSEQASPKIGNSMWIKIKSLLINLRMCKLIKSENLFFTSTLFEQKDENGDYYNSLDGYYYDMFPNNSLLLENSSEYLWRTNKSYPRMSFLDTYLIILAEVIARAIHFFSKNRVLNDIEKLHVLYPCLNKKRLYIDNYFVIVYSYFIEQILKYISPKRVFINCASYGYIHSIVAYQANKLNIETIELQHGLINEKHEAYVADDYIVNNEEYKEYLPKQLWIFGKKWGDKISWKYKKVSVGNPHLNRYLTNRVVKVDYDFLLISQPDSISEIKAFAEELCSYFPEKTILIRRHPMDPDNSYLDVTDNKHVSVSDSTIPLYDDICRTNYIIGLYSTCLYEALAFGKYPIIIGSSLAKKYMDPNFGQWVSAPAQINFAQLDVMKLSCADYWAANFKENVRKAISDDYETAQNN